MIEKETIVIYIFELIDNAKTKFNSHISIIYIF